MCVLTALLGLDVNTQLACCLSGSVRAHYAYHPLLPQWVELWSQTIL